MQFHFILNHSNFSHLNQLYIFLHTIAKLYLLLDTKKEIQKIPKKGKFWKRLQEEKEKKVGLELLLREIKMHRNTPNPKNLHENAQICVVLRVHSRSIGPTKSQPSPRIFPQQVQLCVIPQIVPGAIRIILIPPTKKTYFGHEKAFLHELCFYFFIF